MGRLSKLDGREEGREHKVERSVSLPLIAIILGFLAMVAIGVSAGGIYFAAFSTTTTTSSTTTSTTSTSTSTTTSSTSTSTTESTTSTTEPAASTTTTIPCGEYMQDPCFINGMQACKTGYAINSGGKCTVVYCSTEHVESGRDGCGGWVFQQQNCADPLGAYKAVV